MKQVRLYFFAKFQTVNIFRGRHCKFRGRHCKFRGRHCKRRGRHCKSCGRHCKLRGCLCKCCGRLCKLRGRLCKLCGRHCKRRASQIKPQLCQSNLRGHQSICQPRETKLSSASFTRLSPQAQLAASIYGAVKY